MKVAIVHYAEPVSKDEGFILTRYAALAQQLANCGYQVTRYFPSFNHRSRCFRIFDDYTDEYGAHKCIDTPAYKSSRGINRIRFLSAFKKGILHNISDTDYDVLVVGCPMPGISSALRKQCPNTKIVTDLRDFWPDVQISSATGLKKIVYTMAGAVFGMSTIADLKSSNKVVTLSHSYAKKIKDRCKLNYIPEVIPLGAVQVPTDDVCNVSNALEKSGVVFVGSLSDLFDFKRLLDIWEIVESSHPELAAQNKLAIVGHGSKSEWVSRRASELKYVDIKGFIPQSEAIGLMLESKVAIAIYRQMSFHTLPNKLFEYAASGLPIISNWAGDVIKETQKYGFTYGTECMSNDKIASLIIELLNDPDRCTNSKAGAIQFSKDYSRQSLAEKFSNIVCSL